MKLCERPTDAWILRIDELVLVGLATLLAKTDLIDARLLAHFAEAIHPPVRVLPDEQTRELAEWVQRRHRPNAARTGSDRVRWTFCARKGATGQAMHVETAIYGLSTIWSLTREEVKQKILSSLQALVADGVDLQAAVLIDEVFKSPSQRMPSKRLGGAGVRCRLEFTPEWWKRSAVPCSSRRLYHNVLYGPIHGLEQGRAFS